MAKIGKRSKAARAQFEGKANLSVEEAVGLINGVDSKKVGLLVSAPPLPQFCTFHSRPRSFSGGGLYRRREAGRGYRNSRLSPL